MGNIVLEFPQVCIREIGNSRRGLDIFLIYALVNLKVWGGGGGIYEHYS